MTQVAAAEAESWSTTEAIGLVVVAVALVVGYNRRCATPVWEEFKCAASDRSR